MEPIDLTHQRRARRIPAAERSARTTELLAAAATAAGTGDPAERDRLLDAVVELNMQVAEAVARRYAQRGIPLEDLTQVAYLALVRSVATYDPDRGEDLLTFVVPNLTGEIRRHFRDQGWSIRPPREVQRAHSRILRSSDQRDRYDAEALERLAAEVEESVEVVREALVARDGFALLSLDKPTGAGGSIDVVDVGDHAAEAAEARAMLAPLVATMDERERQILAWRFVDEMSQREIAERLGMTQVQVSRLLQKMLTHLRATIGDVG
ncbi:sigma-70 family RNA polymerase sigma factor [Nocardioides sp. AX2bis]|uniref:sigma-70 family RNA polymerase sigma factor n=1 Tax=Nocardioides sp. AX2bis TaxID=2653157 RepID=UPI0012F1B65F|nr:sigma-70 family RNA polymerase sigma factor [Nocardioides sp. AX2bis]VXC58064.1 RNA polymerase sigma factor SigF [Nocardioides sp. AX2bis]